MTEDASPVRLREVLKIERSRMAPAATDQLTVEEPLEIRIEGRPIAVIMRTPGRDFDLARGFLLTEGIVRRPDEIAAIEPADETAPTRNPADSAASAEAPAIASANRLNVRLRNAADFDPERFTRNFYASSSCGLCGKASIEAVTLMARPVIGDWRIPPAKLSALAAEMNASQHVFRKTGSLHAAALCSVEGALLHLAEDVGRHNAVDKAVGAAVEAGRLPLDRALLLVSGRISFEIAQKALMAGVPFVAAVSGASSLAVDLAEDQGMTLVGFLRGDSMTVYHGAWRLDAD